MMFFCLSKISRKKDFRLFFPHPSQHPSDIPPEALEPSFLSVKSGAKNPAPSLSAPSKNAANHAWLAAFYFFVLDCTA
jgi:hypothetical protein